MDLRTIYLLWSSNKIGKSQNIFHGSQFSLKVLFPQRANSIQDHLPSKFVFHLNLSSLCSIFGCLLVSKIISDQRSYFRKILLSSKDVLQQSLSPINGLFFVLLYKLCSRKFHHTTYFSQNLYLLTMTDRQADTDG